MISNALKYLSYIGAIISLFISLNISKVLGIGILIFCISIFILSKHFENQEIANAHLNNIENLLEKIYLHTVISDDISDDDENDEEETEEYKEPWLDYNSNNEKPIIKM